MKEKKDIESSLSVGRLTKKKLINWLNFQFEKFEIDKYEVYQIDQTRYRGQDYEAGAAALNIWFRDKNDHESNGFFYSFCALAKKTIIKSKIIIEILVQYIYNAYIYTIIKNKQNEILRKTNRKRKKELQFNVENPHYF